MKLRVLIRALRALIFLALVMTACGDETADEQTRDTSPASPMSDAGTTATRDDVDCDPEALGEDESIQFLGAHYVVDGELGAICYGEEDETIFTAWEQLAAITPPEQLSDLFLFTGFSFDSSSESETLAFVNTVDDEGSGFQMSINLDAYDADPTEGALTVAHEFSHVFNGTESQLDRSVFSAEDCDTYYNTEGCFLPGSIMAEWIELFWDDGLVDEIDPAADPEPEDGEQRCANDGQFLGSYAASNPEEDFAETFSAYVFRVGPVSDEVQDKLDWIDEQPGLAEFRDRAEQAGLGPLDNTFERCGLG